ncbi:hypothetical protein [Solobacterium moorei]|uniref:beta-sandwich lipoprotein n=1 Tax=Solobacterium moorei TaxID=102148 RepID=UPI0003F88193|nr:hypothetical protein [Solobacterium moorei]BET21225.1 hypothetical protein RGT18_08130 [Solobacterium moorei]
MKKIIKALALVTLLTTTGCTQADTVRHNITENADSFSITRRITVFNTRTDKVLMQMTGVMSIKTDKDTKELNVLVKDGETYYKHLIYLNDDTTYVMEDIGGADVSRSAYEIHFLPEVLQSGLLDIKVDK